MISSYLKLCRLRQFIKANNIHIVQTVFNESTLSVPLAACGTAAKVVCSRRDMGFWYTPNKLFLLRKLSPFIDKYLANSYAVKENIIDKEAIPTHKVEVIYNGHDFSRFTLAKSMTFRKKLSIPNDSYIVGIVANFRPVKRVADLIVAFSIILAKYPNTYLVIVGDTGGLLSDYNKLAKNLAVNSNIKFLGSIKHVVPVIKHFDVGILCSESEGLSNVLIEYMGCGIPIVATKTGGNAEVIQNGHTGLLVPIHDPRALAAAISRLLVHRDIAIKMSQRAKKYAKGRFLDRDIIDKYEQFYKTLLI